MCNSGGRRWRAPWRRWVSERVPRRPCVWSRRDRTLYRKVRGRTGRLRRRAVHRVRGPVVLGQRGDRLRRRHRVGAARSRGRRRCTGRARGPQPAAARRGHHGVHRGGPYRLDDLFVPVAGVDRPRHRDAGPVGDRRRRGGLDRRGHRGRQAGGQRRRRPRRCGTPTVAAVPGLERRDDSRGHADAGTRCGTADSDQRNHRPAQAAVDQDEGARTHRLQRHQRRGGPAWRPARILVLAVRRYRGLSADRGRLQRQADRHPGAVLRRRAG